MTTELSSQGKPCGACGMPRTLYCGFIAWLDKQGIRLTATQEAAANAVFSSSGDWKKLAHKLFTYGNELDLEASLSAARNVFHDVPVVGQEPPVKLGAVFVDPGQVDVDDRERAVPGAVPRDDDGQIVVLELIGCDVNDKFFPLQPRVAFTSALAAYVIKAAAFLLLKIMREKRDRLAARAAWKAVHGRRQGFRIRLHNRHPERSSKLCQLVYVAVDHRIDDIFISKERPLDIEVLRQSMQGAARPFKSGSSDPRSSAFDPSGKNAR